MHYQPLRESGELVSPVVHRVSVGPISKSVMVGPVSKAALRTPTPGLTAQMH